MNIIIIGATSGIGLDLLKRYAVSGNKIGILGRRKSILKELERCYPSNVITCAADISQQNVLSEAIKFFQLHMQNIDLVIVCSGIGEQNSSLDFNIEFPTLLTNVVGSPYAIDAFYNIINHQGFEHLVTITSIGGLRGEPQAPAYSA